MIPKLLATRNTKLVEAHDGNPLSADETWVIYSICEDSYLDHPILHLARNE
jgi:hypothetical protein